MSLAIFYPKLWGGYPYASSFLSYNFANITLKIIAALIIAKIKRQIKGIYPLLVGG